MTMQVLLLGAYSKQNGLFLLVNGKLGIAVKGGIYIGTTAGIKNDCNRIGNQTQSSEASN